MVKLAFVKSVQYAKWYVEQPGTGGVIDSKPVAVITNKYGHGEFYCNWYNYHAGKGARIPAEFITFVDMTDDYAVKMWREVYLEQYDDLKYKF